jgi:hypothetical protein
MSALFGGRLLSTERDFVLEYWAPLLPAACDVDVLLPPGEPLDAAGAFERCRAAAMDEVMPGYSQLSEGERDAALDAALLAAASDHGTMLAHKCIERLHPAALGKLLAAGVKPGDVDSTGGYSLLDSALSMLMYPYARSAAALPHALASVRVLLARSQPSHWLVGPAGKPLPLFSAASILDPIATQAVLDVIVESPGGFPAHAVAASPGVLHKALQSSTASFVAALLAAGADPASMNEISSSVDGTAQQGRPLHALALANPNGDARDLGDKLRLLLDAGADLEATDGVSWTPLVTAVINERLVAFDALLAAGARASSLRTNTGFIAASF